MTIVKKSRIVSFSCQQMFELVAKVEDYPQFLPYCAESQVHYRSTDEMQATLVIAAAGMKKSFTTRNLHQLNKMIEIRLIDGPFSHLEGFWRFDEAPQGCHISFDLEFEFAGAMISMLLGPIFEQVTNVMVDAFCKRAEVLYAKS